MALIERLLKAYPGIVAGAKDSSGDWNNTKAYLDNFAKAGFDVFPGSETFLLQGLRARRRRLHQRHRQCQSGGHRAGSSRRGRRPTPMPSRSG